VKDNIYTKLSLDDLSKSRSVDLEGSISSRNKLYNTELERQRANDRLCKEFATVAEKFSSWITETKDGITKSSKSLEEQLENVKQRKANLNSETKENMGKINELNGKMEEAGITNNRHTTLTAKDIQVQLQQYSEFLDRKAVMLEEEIASQKLKGITQEQFKEIEDSFNLFDANKSKSIDKKELKTCLYSLGEEKSNSEVDAILKKYGDGKVIQFPGFKDFMVSILGVTDNKEDILRAFKTINGRADDYANLEKMGMVMAGEDIKYVVDTAPKEEKGFNYAKWTESIFAR